MELSFEGQGEEVVLEIEALALLFVVGEHVRAVAEGVVEASVFFYGAVDTVSYARCAAGWGVSRDDPRG